MSCREGDLSQHLFGCIAPYDEYLTKFPLHEAFGLDLAEYGPVSAKANKTAYESVDPTNTTPFPPELDDLIRLHHLVISRRVTTVLEFGVGKSSVIFDLALSVNAENYGPPSDLRRSNLHECHSVDNNPQWIATCRDLGLSERVSLHLSDCRVTTFSDRVCTMFDSLPNICPDLIYLDGPDQFSPIGDIRGISTRSSDRLPMAGDLLSIEHFLLPGTLIVIDGRTANARFLATNFQRSWVHWHSEEFDQHFFELVEPPLGRVNSAQVDYCLGQSFRERVDLWG